MKHIAVGHYKDGGSISIQIVNESGGIERYMVDFSAVTQTPGVLFVEREYGSRSIATTKDFLTLCLYLDKYGKELSEAEATVLERAFFIEELEAKFSWRETKSHYYKYMEDEIRKLVVSIAQKWDGHHGVDFNTTTTENLLKLIDDAVQADHETLQTFYSEQGKR